MNLQKNCVLLEFISEYVKATKCVSCSTIILAICNWIKHSWWRKALREGEKNQIALCVDLSLGNILNQNGLDLVEVYLTTTCHGLVIDLHLEEEVERCFFLLLALCSPHFVAHLWLERRTKPISFPSRKPKPEDLVFSESFHSHSLVFHKVSEIHIKYWNLQIRTDG